jgi:hypothetical protein
MMHVQLMAAATLLLATLMLVAPAAQAQQSEGIFCPACTFITPELEKCSMVNKIAALPATDEDVSRVLFGAFFRKMLSMLMQNPSQNTTVVCALISSGAMRVPRVCVD